MAGNSNEKIIAELDKPQLLLLSTFLSLSLIKSPDELEDWQMFWELDIDAIGYCENLSEYQRIKFLQQIINTLVQEEDQAIRNQMQLPLVI